MPTDRPAPQGLGISRQRFDDLPRLQAEATDLLRGTGERPAPGPGGDPRGELGALARAAAIRFPDLRDKHGSVRINLLADHIMDTAIARGDLEELRLEAHTNLFEAQRDLRAVVTAVTKSKAAADEAKRQARPDLAERIDSARWLVDRCTEQINRMGGSEYDAASRSYTLASGA